MSIGFWKKVVLVDLGVKADGFKGKKQQDVGKPIKCYINWSDLWTYELRYEGDIRGAENVRLLSFHYYIVGGARLPERAERLDYRHLSVLCGRCAALCGCLRCRSAEGMCGSV